MPATNGFRRLLQIYLVPQWLQALLLLVLMLAGVALDLANPQLIRRFIDSALAGEPINALLAIGATFLAVALLTQLALVVEQYLAGNVAWRATNRLRADLTLHCLTLDLSYHGAHPPGELVERVDGDVAKLSEFFSQFLARLLGNLILLLGILLLSFGIEWRVGLALTIFALFALIVIASLRQIGARDWEAQSRASAGLFGFLEEYLSGTEDLRANGATAFALRRLAEQQRTLLRATQRAVLRFLLMGVALLIVNMWICLHWLFLRRPGRGMRRLARWRFRLDRMTRFLIHAIERFYGVVTTVEPIPI